MRCAHCASPLPDGTQFCANCGADVAGPSSGPGGSLDDAGVAKLTRLLRQETAGEYEIEREIARGGMGVVYLASETQLRRRVAIKVLPPAFTFGEGSIERFRREARTAAALDHPNIIPIYRVSSGGELMWYSMKLLEGKTLDAVLAEQRRLAFDRTLTILEQVAGALDYAHRRGVIHRDVKPGNVMLDEHGTVTVTDFGIAKEIQGDSLSASWSLVGTPSYMSPEQYRGGEVSGASDQYSLGVVAYQCLGGRVPFEASSAYELLSKHTTEPPPPLADLRRDLPPYAYAAIERALAKDPAHRFATARDFVHALAGSQPVPPRTTTGRPARWIWWGAGIAAAAVLIYGGTTALRGRTGAIRAVRSAAAADTVVARPAPAISPDAGTSGTKRPGRPARSTPPLAPVSRTPVAVLIVRISNGWARIYVDGELRGERPVHREDLPPGTHSLRFERPGFLPVDTTLTLKAGENVMAIVMRRSSP
jgi:serine/threonine-protein kinase